MAHEYIKENDTFSTVRNGTVPKPSQQDVTDGKVLKADGTWGEGAGASRLQDLSDVDISSAKNGQVLKYISADQKWENKYPHIYSTEEQIVGVTADGKFIYERSKTFPSDQSVTASRWTNLLTTADWNISKLIDLKLYNGEYTRPFYSFMTDMGGGYIKVFVYTTWSVKSIVIQYTKTTD